MSSVLRFVDLFAGIGGLRVGLEAAARQNGLEPRCLFTSEIKWAAREILQQNHPHEVIHGDIREVDAAALPDFDFLLAGFPCQAFSAAGKRDGFLDTRGTLFFEVERILAAKRPSAFLLENVEGLVKHDREASDAPIGRTLATILARLQAAGYKVTWRVLNARNFGLPQDRKRIYIAGTRVGYPDLADFPRTEVTLGSILEQGLPLSQTRFIAALLSRYSLEELAGKSLKDKRGGANNIHSWDLELKGAVSDRQKELLNRIFKERRKKKWAQEYGIRWMDGMPLTESQIQTFFPADDLPALLEDLVQKGYLKREYPKQEIVETANGLLRRRREQDPSLPLGYNIVTGKLSFEVNKILAADDIAPTLVATDMEKLYVVDGVGLRPLSLREGLRLFGFPESFRFDTSLRAGYDLLGNTVAVPVVKAVCERILAVCGKSNKEKGNEINPTRDIRPFDWRG